MIENNKLLLPYVLDGILKKLSSLFLQKLVLFDSEVLEAKDLRHYDLECEGVINLVKFMERKINKNQILAFQMIKNPDEEFYEEQIIIQQDLLKNQKKKATQKSIEETITPRTKFVTRANTTFEQSYNSFILSPNPRKYEKVVCKTQYGSSSNFGTQKNLILRKLLSKVKKVNNQTNKEYQWPLKASSFNLTLGKQSFQSFQNKSNYGSYMATQRLEQKQQKRKKILQKFEKIERKINREAPIYTARPAWVVYRPATQHQTYRPSISHPYDQFYKPITYYERPAEVIYVTSRPREQSYYQSYDNGLLSSRSAAQINYANQVYF